MKSFQTALLLITVSFVCAIDIETYGYPATDIGPGVYPEEFSDEDWEHLGEYFDYPEFEGDFSWDFPEEEWFDYEYEGPRVDEYWTPEGEETWGPSETWGPPETWGPEESYGGNGNEGPPAEEVHEESAPEEAEDDEEDHEEETEEGIVLAKKHKFRKKL